MRESFIDQSTNGEDMFCGGTVRPAGTRTGLWVCVNDSDQIVGWFYGKELEGYEKEAGLD